ncbi:MAG TPA: TlpA disulfide reductase family protein [Longimicrobiales bacterium]|nr:TlpA disulfide reductase family protein [Longimicrobiales bacterium]
MTPRARDWITTAAFLGLIGALVATGWLTRDRDRPVGEGDDAPAFTVESLSGGSLSLESLRGQVVMLNIWATWCAPCRLEMPSMQRAYDRYRDQGLEIVAISVDTDPGVRGPDGAREGVVSRFVEELGLTFPVGVDPDGETERLYEVTGLPTTFLIDREGRIRVRELGGRYWDRPPHVDMIESLLEE